MDYRFSVFCVIFGIMVIRNSVLCITEEEIDKIVERKMEKVIRMYDKKIALLEEKIHAQDVKIQNLEKKFSAPTLDAEEDKDMEKKPFLHFASNRSNDSDVQINSQAFINHEKQKRIVVQGTEKINTKFVLNKIFGGDKTIDDSNSSLFLFV